MSEAIKVYIVDDHDIVRDGLKAMFILDDKIEICGEAGSGDEFFASLAEPLPDIVLLDLSMPGMPGTVLITKLKSLHPQIKIIVLTGSFNKERIRDCIDLDVDGFLLKNSNKEILFEALHAVYLGKQFYDYNISQTIVNEYLKIKKKQRKNENELSTREEEVVKWLAKGLSHKEISEKLFISKRTVDTHVTHIMDKLNCSSKAEIIFFAIKKGIVDIYQ